ncbi:hypothetical protein ACLB2K_060223 [Fragaria x ananassa]
MCDNVLGTIMGAAGKIKDNLRSRRDLEDMGIRKQYHVKEREDGTKYFEPADFEMKNDGKDKFLLALSQSRMPDGSASNIARRVRLKGRTIGADLEEARSRIIVTLCDLEKIFSPSFFDVMEHLPIHLVEEALIAGAVQFRWMYPIEREHMSTIKNQYPNANDVDVARIHFDEFVDWFKAHVSCLQNMGDVSLPEEIVALSNPPSPSAARLKSYTSKGHFFRVKSVDNKRTRQNNGVSLQGDTLLYYGRLTEIIKISYSIDIKYVLFRCEWAHPSAGVKKDPFNFTLVNFRRLLYQNDRVRDEPFILASQAHQVWYIPDPSGEGWINVSEVESKDFSHVQFDTSDEMESVVTMLGKKRKVGRPRHMSEFLSPSGSASSHNGSSSSQSSYTSIRPPLILPTTLPSPPQPTPPSTLPLPAPGMPQPTSNTVSRGHNKGIPEWNTGEKVNIMFDSKFQPIGERATQLKSQLGKIVCDGRRILLTIMDWKSVDDKVKEGIWNEVKMEQSGEESDKFSVWKKARKKSNPEVAQVIHEYNRKLLLVRPVEDQKLTAIKDRVFHDVIGEDGHGYCRTYGSTVPHNLVYPQEPLETAGSNDLIAKITEEVTEKLKESFDKKLEDAIKMLQAQIANNMDCTTAQGGEETQLHMDWLVIF